MDRIFDVELQGVVIDRASGQAVLFLREPRSSERVLPIVIGAAEAASIAASIAGPSSRRPLTHDLFVRVIEAFDARVRRVDVVGLDHGAYLAEIEIETPAGVIRVDARPSDGIALAVRTSARIGVDRELYEATAVDVTAGDVHPLDDAEVERIVDASREQLAEAGPPDLDDSHE